MMVKKQTITDIIGLIFVFSAAIAGVSLLLIISNVPEIPYDPIYSIIFTISGIITIISWITFLRRVR